MSAEPVSVEDLISGAHEERLVYCSWCGAEPGDSCSEWEKPIDHYHPQRRAHLLDLRIALVVPALKEAGVWLGQQRHSSGGRRYANALLFGEVIHARGDDLEWRSEREAKRIRHQLDSDQSFRPERDA